MMDGSLEDDGKTPADYDYNVEVTRGGRRAWPMPRGVSVEGELGLPRLAIEDGHGAEGRWPQL